MVTKKRMKHIAHITTKHPKPANQPFLLFIKFPHTFRAATNLSSLPYKNGFYFFDLHANPFILFLYSNFHCQTSLILFFLYFFLFLRWKTSAIFYYSNFHLHLSPDLEKQFSSEFIFLKRHQRRKRELQMASKIHALPPHQKIMYTKDSILEEISASSPWKLQWLKVPLWENRAHGFFA